MSFAAIAWAVRQKLPAMQKIVLMMLADRHNGDTGRCDPSHDKLATDCGMGRRTVIVQIEKLRAAGLVQVINRSRDGIKSSNSYVLNIKSDVQDKHIDVQQVHRGSAADAQGVVHEMHINQEVKPVKEPNIYKCPEEVSPEVWKDFLAVRNGLNAPLTKTGMEGIYREAAKAGLSIEQALVICIERSWRSFKAEWLAQKKPRTSFHDEQAKRFAELTGSNVYEEVPNVIAISSR